MKLDVNVLRYLSKEDFRVLTAIEMGQKNVRCAVSLKLSRRAAPADDPAPLRSTSWSPCSSSTASPASSEWRGR